MTTPARSLPTPEELAAAYLVAARREADRVRQGATLVGHKVGFTNRAVWPQLGANAPMWGAMYDDTVLDALGAPFPYSLSAFHGPRIEPEIVVHFSRAPSADATPESLIDCIDWLAAGYEIVLTPPDNRPPTVAQAIANGGMHGALLVGERRATKDLGDNLANRLAEVRAGLYCDGELKESGSSASVLGNPLNAILHLIQGLAAYGRPPIQAGDTITTGTMTAAYPISPGQRWELKLEGLALPDLDVAFE